MKGNTQILRPSDAAAELKLLAREQGVDLFGIADLRTITDMPLGIPVDAALLLNHFQTE